MLSIFPFREICHGLERRLHRLFLRGSVATSKDLHGHFTATSHRASSAEQEVHKRVKRAAEKANQQIVARQEAKLLHCPSPCRFMR